MPSTLDEDNSIIHCDQLLKEYLVWRGFNRTLTNFEMDRKMDKNKAFQTEKIVEQLFQYIRNYEIHAFMDYWGYLEKQFFSKLYESSGFYNKPSSSSTGHSNLSSSSSTNNFGGDGGDPSNTSSIIQNNSSSASSVSTSSSTHLDSQSTSNTTDSLSPSSSALPTSSTTNANNHTKQSLKKYYVVHCAQNRRIRECREFFERYGPELIQEQEWTKWFALPYLLTPYSERSIVTASTPRGGAISDGGSTDLSSHAGTLERERRESNASSSSAIVGQNFSVLSIVEQCVPELEPYFHNKWAEMLYVSVQNFVATAVMSVEKPTLLLMESEKRDRLNVLKKKLDVLISENETLKSKLLAAEAYISKLETEVGIRREGNISHSDSPVGNVDSSSTDNHSRHHNEQQTPNKRIPSSHSFSSLIMPSSARQSASNTTTTPSQKGSISPNSPSTVSSSNASNSTPTDQGDYITSLKFSFDGKYLASSSKDNTVRIWSLLANKESGNTTSFGSIQTYECGTKAMCIDWWSTSNGKRGSSSGYNNVIVCGLNNRKVKILDLDKRKCTAEFCTEIFYPRVNAIACCGSSIRNSDYCVVSCSSYQKSDSSSASSGTPQNIGNSSPSSLSGMLLGYNLNQLKLENKYLIQPKNLPILDIKFNHNGTMLVTAGSDGYIQNPVGFGSEKQNSNWINTKISLCSTSERMFVLNYPGTVFSLLHNSPTHCLMTKDFYSNASTNTSSTTSVSASDFSPMTNVDWFNAAFGGSSGSNYQYLNWIAASHGVNNNIYLYNMDLT
ncbi:hypothetical protein C9374_001947 [Naegleria lovaniensis]|uniref:ARMC9 CTLH-like domain-containing protein n=1 Tax=Naegleria lovaniensis TaxID=51637 RepID=A0AA88GTT3_NAELO|nr:uncharacterized protein C9374_001947 [Naegleria lovaniensis]KAG2386912.1 hypothetical protein C9374_001947 [Naegleria lovaniensis]